MDEFCKSIGTFVVTAIMFAVPILFACSITLRWDTRVMFTLVILTAVDFIILWAFVDEHT